MFFNFSKYLCQSRPFRFCLYVKLEQCCEQKYCQAYNRIRMNIYTILMGTNKGETLFPKIAAKDIIRGNSSYTSKKLSTENIRNRSIDKDNRKFRITYHDILQIPVSPGLGNLIAQQPKQQQAQMKKTQPLMKRSSISNCVRINGYQLIAQIGKGGFAQVFEAKNQDGQHFAVKQYILANSPQCFKNQCTVGEHFFEKGKIRSKFAQKRGCTNLIKYYQKIKYGKKGYIVQQIGGKSLSKMISDIQGVFYKGERVYQVKFTKFYQDLIFKKNLKDLLIQMAQGVKLLNSEGFIHCDLKPQNILVSQLENGTYNYKLIDFGSSFCLGEGLPKITITPQYMPPELLEQLSSSTTHQQLERHHNSIKIGQCGPRRLSKIDIWSLGCVLLEIVTGVPLWFRYKCKIYSMTNGKQYLQLGFFALTNRQYHKILKKQKEICSNLKKINFIHKQFECYRPLLMRMLTYDPIQRADIDEILGMLKLP